jgi:2-hydroxychromene-2-carboxylate isomerase
MAHRALPGIEARTNTQFRYVPMLLGGVFKATNNVSPAISLQGILNKGEYQALETQRFIAEHDISDYARNPYFPVNTLQLMRGAIVAEEEGFLPDYVEQVFIHMWSQPKKMDELDIFRNALSSSGLPVGAIMTGITSADIKQKLIANTEQAVARGIFGAPSFFVNEQLFFGKDKLGEVENWINKLG